MCIIINNSAGLKLTVETIEDCLAANPDGVGFYDLTTGKLKKTLDPKIAAVWLASETPFVAHCRYATCGKVCIENVHPFEFGDKLIMMNGTVSGYFNEYSNDTRQLVAQLDYVKDDGIVDFLECFAARFCIIDTVTRTAHTIGKWVCRDGIEFSNDRIFDKKRYVAVYGTLKYGYSNFKHYLGDADFLDYGTTEETYKLCVSNLPYLIDGPDDKGEFIDVEVYAVSFEQLAELDMLEGHPDFYERKLCRVDLDRNGETISAWIYFVDDSFDTGEYVSSFEEERHLDYAFLEECKEETQKSEDEAWDDDAKYTERDRDDTWTAYTEYDKWEEDDEWERFKEKNRCTASNLFNDHDDSTDPEAVKSYHEWRDSRACAE